MAVVEPETLNSLMDLQEDTASYFLADPKTMMSGQTYWTCVEALAQTKLAEMEGQIEYTPNQRFETIGNSPG
jgi:hypothetical protein